MSELIIKGARENNLKGIDVNIPDNKVTVIVGPSGSGKSSLAFQTIYKEGQRRYIESLSSYTRQFLEKIEKPKFDDIINISPTVAVEQKNKIRNSRSTVSSITEVYDYLSFLFAKIGKIVCPKCNKKVKKFDIKKATEFIFNNYLNKKIFLMFFYKGKKEFLLKNGFLRILKKGIILNVDELKNTENGVYVIYDRIKVKEEDKSRVWDDLEKIKAISNNEVFIFDVDNEIISSISFELICSCGEKFLELDPRLFSFDSPMGACPNCNGFGNTLEIDEEKIVPDSTKSLIAGAIDIFNKPSFKHHFYSMIEFLRSKKVNVNKPFCTLNKKEKELIYKGGKTTKVNYLGIDKFFKILEKKKYKVYVRVFLSKYKTAFKCKVCKGSRLKQGALSVYVEGYNIFEIQKFSFKEFYKWLSALTLSSDEKNLIKEILKQLYIRASFINEIGLGYLSLNRKARTLSSGESQRISLTNQLAASLVSTIYVLDEPSIGLHPLDVDRLIKIIKKIKENGNKVVLVEHDPYIIKSFDNIIELGEGGGIHGGNLVFQGSMDKFLETKTLTATSLKNNLIETNVHRSIGEVTKFLKIDGLKENNLKNLNIKIPLERFVAVTGVSGSGKSTLITNSIFSILDHDLNKKTKPVSYNKISGLEHIDEVLVIDQNPISVSRKSMPITFLGGFDIVRKYFESAPLSKARAYKNSHFSFNTKKGQCENCSGDGFLEIDMQFMPSINIKCDECKGTRYKKEILDIKYKGKNINEVLSMTVDEAYKFFINSKNLRNIFKLLIDIGLSYINIGQPLSSLSGGEAQRLKITKELLKGKNKKKNRNFYIMDEPTTGLHPSEVNKLINVIQNIISKGGSVVAIEHNMDFIKNVDYVVDLGPGGGKNGGKIVCEGTVNDIINCKESYTGKFLKEVFCDE
jgi:excinuclease ABC subunit A